MMELFIEVLGKYFLTKILLIPSILGFIFICKNLLRKNKFTQNKFLIYLFYSLNFTFWLVMLKFVFVKIDPNPHVFSIKDISLIFTSILIDYFIVSYYKYIEYTVLPFFVVFYFAYLNEYGFTLQSFIVVWLALASFWFLLLLVSKKRVDIIQNIPRLLLVSLILVLVVLLIISSQFPINFLYALTLFGKIFILLCITKIIFKEVASIIEEYSKYKEYTYIDELTGVYNRRKFDETFKELLNSDTINKFSLVLFDVDSFKQINDKYGHLSGDIVLRDISYLVEKHLRENGENGQLFRFGGDEFFIIFRNRSGNEVKKIMVEIVKKISCTEFQCNSFKIKASISAGIVEATPGALGKHIISQGDKNLYEAKARGKNQVYLQ
ncbi:GGDEF domain-containing protein [Lactococcus taiwanensis]|uniref:GGDEF domain-containing protein n=2 Tax=Lactococcus taiwanensis TaxID=1151742 RepID=UPI00289D810D|nr:GGDEF domain-containing protein [Lactococcus taiwanensis]